MSPLPQFSSGMPHSGYGMNAKEVQEGFMALFFGVAFLSDESISHERHSALIVLEPEMASARR